MTVEAKPTRRALIGAAAALAAVPSLSAPARGIVRRQGTRLLLDGRPYRFVGTNMWYAAYLAADAPYGDPDRLRRELDRLQALGIRTVRILGGSEASPLKNAVSPSFRGPGKRHDKALLAGLDLALAEMARRDMRAVIYLTNFWEWSGGMMAHLHWVNGGRYLDMNDPAHPWPEFPNMVADFYATPPAVALYHDYLRALVGRTSTVTGRRYRDDPAILAWQLANEPRPGGDQATAAAHMAAFQRWVAASARLIKSLDPNHLVSTGSEGLKGCVGSEACVLEEHGPPEIDYLTAHVWPLNWGWIDAADLPGTAPKGRALVAEYLARHEALAAKLGKPLVIEEFGYPRDGGSYDPAAATRFKDLFYRQIYDAVEASARVGGPIAGSNFWAWNGEGRARADHRFRVGDANFLGDPPHEPQGWYGVFDTDRATQELVRAHAAVLAGA